MKKLLLLLMLIGFALLGSNYDRINGKVSGLEISKNFISLKLSHSTTKAEFKKEISAIKYLPKISEIKTLSDNSFVIKFKSEISSNIINKLEETYKVLPSYTLNQEYWPLVTDNTINIKFKSNVLSAKQKQILSENDLKIVDTDIFNDRIHTIITNEDAFYMSNKLFNTGLFDFSNPNFYMFHIKKFTPNDTYFPNEWHHASNSAGVYSEGAWDINRGSSSVKIAIIDDGMELNHPDLNVILSRDFSGSTGAFNDGGEHGTSCGGVAAAKGNNGIGVSGACPNCSIIAAKIMREDGYSLQNADANAFNWVTSQGADVFNNSWGYQQDFDIDSYNPRLVSAINYAVTNGRNGRGGVVLFASGNENRRFSSSSLEALPNIIAVGATTNYGSRASYSNYGSGLDVVAPSNGGSEGIYTTDRLGNKGYNHSGHYVVEGTDYGSGTDISDDDYSKNFGGTSSATPLVSGIVGLMFSENANLTPQQVRQILENTADKIGSASNYDSNGHSDYLGYGKVNAKNALIAVRNLSGCTPDPNGENCSNNIDDDCDGAVDANDSDCGGGTPTACDGVNCPENSHCDVDNSNQAGCYCNTGYHVNDARDACVADSGNTDVCDGVDCNASYPNSVCVDNGGQAACGCPDGWTWNSGQTACEQGSTDPCTGISCSNHGTCVNNGGVASCNCDNGYTASGLHCVQTNVNPCEGITCSGHGVCANNNGIANCNCDTGYISDGSLHCLVDNSNPCEGIICSNHGVCANYNGNAKCNCDAGYIANGLYCVQDNNPCDGVTCSNHGTCANYDDGAKCNCNAGYHRDNNLHCLIDNATNPCEGIACSGHGVCVENAGSIQCNCDTGYHTDNNLNCFMDTDVCAGISCSGHGVCAKYDGSAKCNCNIGYYSDNNLHCIQGTTDVCSNVTCSNHGSCYNNNDVASCNCDSGYTSNGVHCIKDSTNNSNSSGCNYSSENDNSLLFLLFFGIIAIIWTRKKYKKLNN